MQSEANTVYLSYSGTAREIVIQHIVDIVGSSKSYAATLYAKAKKNATHNSNINVCVMHCSATIMHIGTYSECKWFRDAQVFDASSWIISSVEDFGEYCFSEGYDSGHDAGYNGAQS